MAFPKAYLFSEDDQEVSQSGKILAHPARITILRLLRDRGPMPFAELLRSLPLNQGTVTSHVKKLRLYGLLDVEEKGLINIYSLDRGRLAEMFAIQRGLEADLTGVREI